MADGQQPTTWLGLIGSALGGGALAALITAITKRREIVSAETVDQREAIEQVAEEDRADRRRLEQTVGQLQEKVTTLTGAIARCEEQHLATRKDADREREERRSLSDDVHALKSHIGLLESLVEKQRVQIDRLVRSLMEMNGSPAE